MPAFRDYPAWILAHGTQQELFMRSLIATISLLAFVISLGACNTVEGAGKDTKNAGQSIENAAERNK